MGTAGRAHALGLLPFFFLFFFGGRWGAPVVVGTHPVVVTAGRKLKKKKKERDNEERNGWRPIAGVLYAMEYTWRGSCPDAVFSSLFFYAHFLPLGVDSWRSRVAGLNALTGPPARGRSVNVPGGQRGPSTSPVQFTAFPVSGPPRGFRSTFGPI